MVGNKIKKQTIFIVTSSPFPVGFAPTNRIISYGSGLVQNNCSVQIIVYRRTEKSENVLNIETSGCINRVPFLYTTKSTVQAANVLKKNIDKVVGILKLFLFCIFKISKNDTVIYYSSYTSPLLFVKMAQKIKKFLLLKEESEHPSVYIKNMNVFSRYIFSKFHYSLFDGLLLMTTHLVDYFTKTFPEIPSVLIPMTVDMTRFTSKPMIEKNITYIGALDNQKDGLDLLIEAFSIIASKYEDYKLLLYGYSIDNKALQKNKNKVYEYNLEDRILFCGSVGNYEVPNILAKSCLLVLPRPDSQQARYGFPTKLGEYLASGNPVVATAVGEIPKYLKDNIDVFFVEPGSIYSLSSKIEEVLSDLDNAVKVGKQGKNTAKRLFNNKTQTRKILQFISRTNKCAE